MTAERIHNILMALMETDMSLPIKLLTYRGEEKPAPSQVGAFWQLVGLSISERPDQG